MLVDDLPSLSELQSDDEFPVERGTSLYKAKLSQIMSDDIVYSYLKVNQLSEAASGPLISFDDAAVDAPLKELIVTIKPTELLAGRTTMNVILSGKNICYRVPNNPTTQVQTSNGVTFTPSAIDDSFIINGTVDPDAIAYGQYSYYSSWNSAQWAIPFRGKQITCSVRSKSNNVAAGLGYFKSANSLGSENRLSGGTTTLQDGVMTQTHTVPQAATKFRILFSIPAETVEANDVAYLQVELGPNATEYEKFTNRGYSVSVPSAASPLYGGEWDVLNGKLKVTRAGVTLNGSETLANGSSAWSYVEDTATAHRDVFQVNLSSNTSIPTADSYTNTYLSGDWEGTWADSIPSLKSARDFKEDTYEKSWLFRPKGSNGGGRDFYLVAPPVWEGRPASGAAVSAADKLSYVKAKLAETPLAIVYPVYTPTTYSIAIPTITTTSGINNLWSEMGDIKKLVYYKDLGKYLLKTIDGVKEIIAPQEVASSALANRSVGDYIIVDNTLYRVTRAISRGTAITVGSNVEATTIGAELKRILTS